MGEKDLIKKIKKLDKIHPSRQWMGLLRRNLSAQIDFELAREESNGFSFFGSRVNGFQSMALAASLMMIIVFGPWLALKASEASLPGEFLYTVKKASEDIQEVVTSDQNKTRLRVEFANRRLEELARITNDSFTPLEERNEKTREVITDFRDNLASFSQNIKGISSKEEAVIVAQKTKQLKENLDKTKGEVPLLKDEINGAEKAINEINQEILSVLTGKTEEISQENATTTDMIDEEILIFLETVTSTPRE